MTDPSDKKPKSRRNSFDADLDAMLDEAELSLNSMPDLDEDAIDRLLVDDGFDAEDGFDRTEDDKFEPILDDMPFMDEQDEAMDLLLAQADAEMDVDDGLRGLAETGHEQDVHAQASDMDDLDLLLAQADADSDEGDDRIGLTDSGLMSDEQPDTPAQPREMDDLDLLLAQADADSDEGGGLMGLADSGLMSDEQSDTPEQPSDMDDLDLLLAQADADSDEGDGLMGLADAGLMSDEQPDTPAQPSDMDDLDLLLAQADAELDDGDGLTGLAESGFEPEDTPDLPSQPSDMDELDAMLDQVSAGLLAEAEAGSESLTQDQIIESEPLGQPSESATESDLADDADILAVLQEQEADLAEQLALEQSRNQEQELADLSGYQDSPEELADDGPETETNEGIIEDTGLLSEPIGQAVESIGDRVDEPEQAPQSDPAEDFSVSEAYSAVEEESELAVESSDTLDDGIELPEHSDLIEAAGLDADTEFEPDPEPDEEDFDIEELMKAAEVELAEQISAELLDEGRLGDDVDIGLTDSSMNDAVDEFSGLEIIDDEPGGLPMQPDGYDEFADDDLMSVGNDAVDEFTEPEDALQDEEDQASAVEDDFLLADFDISPGDDDIEPIAPQAFDDIDQLFAEDDALFDLPEAEQSDVEVEQFFSADTPPQEPEIPAETLGLAALAQFKAEQESINQQQKKLITDLENKSKKSVIFTYAALGFGVLALAIAAYLGVVAHSAKNEVNKLNDVIAGFDKKLAELPMKVPEIEGPDAEVSDALVPEQVDTGPAAEVNPEHDKPDHKPSTEHDMAKASGAVKNQPHEQSPKAETETVVHGSAAESADEASTKAQDIDSKEPVQAHAKTPATDKADSHGQVTKAVPEKAEKPLVTAKSKTADDAKPDPKPEQKKSKPDLPEKPGLAVKVQKVVQAKPKPKKQPIKNTLIDTQEKVISKTLARSGDWSVNLIAVKQDWYAKGKASEFRQKGVPVDVVTVNINNVIWYRLRVRGFNGQSEANAYAGRVKKALNLSSVWVGK